MLIPSEPIGSIPRPKKLMEAMCAFAERRISGAELESQYEEAVRDTIEEFESTGSPVITDGEQTKPSFATYPIHGSDAIAPGGVTIPFADGHIRQLPFITKGPFRYKTYAFEFMERAKKYAHVPLKQAVISASAISLLYPQDGIPGYSREAFIHDLLEENETDIRKCLQAGAHRVQIDFTEGRLAVKLDPSGGLLKNFVALNNKVLERFSEEERKKIGIHTCPGGDRDSTHSADVDYAKLLPDLFELMAGNFYIQLASEKNRTEVLKVIRSNAKSGQTIFIGVTDPISSRIESPEEVREGTLEAANYINPERLGTTDDCGFSPFGDDISTSRETAFSKIRSRIMGTEMATDSLGR